MAIPTMQDLLEAGVHFGHQTRRWNPKMKKFIFAERNGIYIIDLQKTLRNIEQAYQAVRTAVENGDSVLFVGTKKQARPVITEEAVRCGMFYVTERWLGGMLTNFTTIQSSIKRLEELEKMKEHGIFDALTKKEAAGLEKERDRMERVLGGIRNMRRLPGILFVVDARKERIAVAEANALDIPVVSILDTNCDPDLITYPVPGNDDALRSISLITKIIADAAEDGTRRTGREQLMQEKKDDDETEQEETT
ncbi:MAG: 30S ribosomal protein S2 [candidate division Zixibacteria bacterium]|nr:30S ribosomal protein S2 [candidate division Zixibacteria bacterium]